MDRFTKEYWDSRRARFERAAALLPAEVLTKTVVMVVYEEGWHE